MIPIFFQHTQAVFRPLITGIPAVWVAITYTLKVDAAPVITPVPTIKAD